MMVDKRCCRDSSGLCCCQSTEKKKVSYDNISRLAREFCADIVGPDRSGEKASGVFDMRSESLGSPAPDEAPNGWDIEDRILRRM
jgi:hypothetical protein